MKLNKGHYHEICDRSSIIAENIETHLIVAYKGGDKFVKQKAEEAQSILYEIYQHAGSKM